MEREARSIDESRVDRSSWTALGEELTAILAATGR